MQDVCLGVGLFCCLSVGRCWTYQHWFQKHPIRMRDVCPPWISQRSGAPNASSWQQGCPLNKRNSSLGWEPAWSGGCSGSSSGTGCSLLTQRRWQQQQQPPPARLPLPTSPCPLQHRRQFVMSGPAAERCVWGLWLSEAGFHLGVPQAIQKASNVHLCFLLSGQICGLKKYPWVLRLDPLVVAT